MLEKVGKAEARQLTALTNTGWGRAQRSSQRIRLLTSLDQLLLPSPSLLPCSPSSSALSAS